MSNSLCSECGKSFETTQKLANHQRYHVEAPSPCTVCALIFKNKFILKLHMRKHVHPEYYCEQCNKYFKFASGLSRHKRLHRKKGHYICQYCDSKFSRKDYLNMHLNSCFNKRRKKNRFSLPHQH